MIKDLLKGKQGKIYPENVGAYIRQRHGIRRNREIG
jgi:hypothetical protein